MTDKRTNARARTDWAIRTAAVTVLARDATAALGDVAAAANVSRSSLHRYFRDRDALLDAVTEDALGAVGQALAEAAADQGHPTDAFQRVVAGLVGCGDEIAFLFTHPHLWRGHPTITSFVRAEGPIRAMLDRGRESGVFAPEFSNEWVERALWSIVYAAIRGVQEGSLPRHLAAQQATRLLLHGITSPT